MTDEAVCTETQKIPSLPDGAYALKEVELTEKGQVTVQLRDQLKIYTNNRFMFAFVHPEYGIDVGAGIATWKNSVMVEEPRVNQKGAVNGLTFDIDIKTYPRRIFTDAFRNDLRRWPLFRYGGVLGEGLKYDLTL